MARAQILKVPHQRPGDVIQKFPSKIWFLGMVCTYILSGDSGPMRAVRSKRTFTGPDGRSYRWEMLYSEEVVSAGRVKVVRPSAEYFFLQLTRNDGSNTEVARYHRASLGLMGPKQKSYLDIDPDVTHMLDLIILTFVYVEKLRMDGETAAIVAAASG